MRTIRQWREERGLTQEQLAQRIGKSAMVISHWETGYRGMTARNLQAVARALGVSMDDIELPGTERREDGERS